LILQDQIFPDLTFSTASLSVAKQIPPKICDKKKIYIQLSKSEAGAEKENEMTKEEFILTIAKDIYIAKGISIASDSMGESFKKLVDKVKEAYDSIKEVQPGLK